MCFVCGYLFGPNVQMLSRVRVSMISTISFETIWFFRQWFLRMLYSLLIIVEVRQNMFIPRQQWSDVTPSIFNHRNFCPHWKIHRIRMHFYWDVIFILFLAALIWYIFIGLIWLDIRSFSWIDFVLWIFARIPSKHFYLDSIIMMWFV